MKRLHSEDGLSIYSSPIDLNSLGSVKDELKTGTVVIFKNVFAPEETSELRKLVFEWSSTLPPLSFEENANKPNLNFHRIDGAPEKSSLPHIFHQYGFGDVGSTNGKLKSRLTSFTSRLLGLQNTLADTSYSMSDENVRAKVLQYVSGGGFLAAHTHPIEPQRVGLICALSKVGIDFLRGGTTFDAPSKKIDTGPHHDIGDVIAFRYDLPHEVEITEPDSEIDWKSEKGRWTLVLELLDTHNRSNSE
ncbi:MAG: hypothetical protein JJ934_09830 [Pseudomonadales bacterium]|nr:hypothetical protein [Pseudomonadales bacterium]